VRTALLARDNTKPVSLSSRRPALAKLAEALSEHLSVPVTDEWLQATAVALLDGSVSMYRVMAAGDGYVKIYAHGHWLENTTMAITSLPDPQNRRPQP
jgi:hypothetical protein